ncbi:CBS domain-containing protein [Paucidesulfovibrio longus]|uniref:CBS domain-containing protein n=1 Tax=Paucidesulfovibrio longus TaxID=889 RepID=UPI0003B6E91E|nr:response regulator [Paucidesulfovibrio longus]
MMKIRVLLVDDDDRFRSNMARLLEMKGFEIISADNAVKALEMTDQDPDVVVSDFQMPNMNGNEFVEAFKERRPTTQVIMLTGYGSIKSAIDAYCDGAFDYLTKPCDINYLASRITDAYKSAYEGWHAEISAEDLMIPLSEYTTVREDETVLRAVQKLREHNERVIPTDATSDKGHRSIIVLNAQGEPVGYLTIRDLITALYKAHISAQPESKETTRFSRFFWDGVFTRQVEDLLDVQIKDVMSAHTERVEANATLIEVAERMFSHNLQRLLVEEDGKVVGIIRDHELYAEIDRIAKSSS